MSQPKRLNLEDLYDGNQRFIQGKPSNNAGHIRIDKQIPPFLLFNCADSRLPGSLIFDVPVGSIFTSANIANQFSEHDLNTKSILSFAVGHVGVDHVIVMGHYECGGVGAAMDSPPPDPISAADITIHEYISPIRKIYQTSERAEIASFRGAGITLPTHSSDDPDYCEITRSNNKVIRNAARALVEENVKAQVYQIATSELMRQRFASESADVYVHGFVYELETGQVYDLRVSVGPQGASPPTPFPPVPTNTL